MRWVELPIDDMRLIAYRYLRSWPSLGHCRRNGELVYNPRGEEQILTARSDFECLLVFDNKYLRKKDERNDISDQLWIIAMWQIFFLVERDERRGKLSEIESTPSCCRWQLATDKWRTLNAFERWSRVFFALLNVNLYNLRVNVKVSSYAARLFFPLRSLEFNSKCHFVNSYFITLEWRRTNRKVFQH